MRKPAEGILSFYGRAVMFFLYIAVFFIIFTSVFSVFALQTETEVIERTAIASLDNNPNISSSAAVAYGAEVYEEAMYHLGNRGAIRLLNRYNRQNGLNIPIAYTTTEAKERISTLSYAHVEAFQLYVDARRCHCVINSSGRAIDGTY